MSHIERRQEVEEWDVEICDTCGHEQSDHRQTPLRVELKAGAYYIASGCMMLQHDGRILTGEPVPNPYPRCPCTEFK